MAKSIEKVSVCGEEWLDHSYPETVNDRRSVVIAASSDNSLNLTQRNDASQPADYSQFDRTTRAGMPLQAYPAVAA
jgi:hypothetical protein